MRFTYSTTDPSQDAFDSLPHLPLRLRADSRALDVVGLVDSGATVHVLPYEVGLQLGMVWDDRRANIRLAGTLCCWTEILMPFVCPPLPPWWGKVGMGGRHVGPSTWRGVSPPPLPLGATASAQGPKALPPSRGRVKKLLSRYLGNQLAIPVFMIAEIADFTPVRLAFAWVQSLNAH
jgi:hypothetical protein